MVAFSAILLYYRKWIPRHGTEEGSALGSRLHLTGIAPTYAARWDGTYALREIIQNLLDVATEHGATYRIEHARGVATLSDTGPGLALRHLVFGVSEKGQDSIGQFGEGLKLGLLVAAREGRKCEIRTGTYKVSPIVARDADMDTDVLALRIRDDMPVIQGTVVTYACTGEELEAAKAGFAAFCLGKIEHLTPQISLPGGWVYANGAVIWSGESLFSYHLQDKTLTNRDRDAAGMDRLLSALAEVWRDTDSAIAIGAYLKAGLSDALPELEDKIPARMPQHYAIWQDAAVATIGAPMEKIAVSDGSTEKDAVCEHLHYTVVQGSYRIRNTLARLGARWASDIAHGTKTGTEIRPRDLTLDEYANLRSAVRTVSRRCGDVGRIKLVAGLQVSGCRAHGCYNAAEDRITLDRSILASLPLTIKTLVHEQVHRLAQGANDRTEEYQTAAVDLVVKLLLSHKH